MSPKLMDSIIANLGDFVEGADGRTSVSTCRSPFNYLSDPMKRSTKLLQKRCTQLSIPSRTARLSLRPPFTDGITIASCVVFSLWTVRHT